MAALRAAALGLLRSFEREARDLAIRAEDVALSQAALAGLLDDTALRTPWGVAGSWGSQPIVAIIAPGLTGAGFYDGVERMLAEPEVARATLDLVLACLSLGLCGHCWGLADAAARADALREKLWRVLGMTDTASELSPEVAGLAAPPVGPSGGLMDWARSALRQPSAADAALVDGLTREAARDPADMERQVLRERFAQAIATLGSILRRKGQSLTRMPWYAVIGPPGVGKTSALRNSGLDFPLLREAGIEMMQGFAGTRHCDFWPTDHALFLDIAGRFVLHDSDAERDRRDWQGFLGLLSRTRARQPLNGVILVIGVVDLLRLAHNDRQRLAGALRARLVELQDGLGLTLPTYVVITKLDLIAGFVEFFDELDREAREKVLGFTLPLVPDELGAVPRWRFLPRFDRLVERQRDLGRGHLSRERDARRRALAHDFPAQLASLARPLCALLEQVFDGAGLATPLRPRGVYLTSAKQEGVPIDRWSPLVAETLRTPLRPPEAHREGVAGRAFFLHRLYGALMPGEAGLVARVDAGRDRRPP